MLCSGSLDCSIRVWDLSTAPPARAPGAKVDSLPNGEAGSGFGSCQTILKGHKDYVLSVGGASRLSSLSFSIFTAFSC